MADFEHNSATFGYINLDDLEGVQTALSKLGFLTSKVDGKMGPKTREAVRGFQASAQITVDGDPGPNTKGALQKSLDEKAAPPAPVTPAAPSA